MYIKVYLIIYKIMLIINIIIPGKIEEWGFVLDSLSQISRPSEGRTSGVFPYQWYLDFWHQVFFKVTIMSH